MPRTATTIAAALATLAVAAPVAAARPLEAGYVAHERVQTATTPAPAAATQDSGFDWLDAAIGAAVTAGVFSLTGAGVMVVRRTREDATTPLGAH